MRALLKGKRLLLLISLWTTAHACLAAGEVNRSWEELMRSIISSKEVVVTRMNSARVEGKVLSLTAESITVNARVLVSRSPDVFKKMDGEVPRSDVFRVRYAGIQRRHILWGLLIGGAVAAAVLPSTEDRHKGEAAVMGALFIGFPIGGVVGAAWPPGPPLYEAEKVVRKAP
jgi:hypothetical protein